MLSCTCSRLTPGLSASTFMRRVPVVETEHGELGDDAEHPAGGQPALGAAVAVRAESPGW